MGFQKKVWMGGWGEVYPSFYWIFGIFLTLQSPLVQHQLSNVRVDNSIAVDGYLLSECVVSFCLS